MFSPRFGDSPFFLRLCPLLPFGRQAVLSPNLGRCHAAAGSTNIVLSGFDQRRVKFWFASIFRGGEGGNDRIGFTFVLILVAIGNSGGVCVVL